MIILKATVRLSKNEIENLEKEIKEKVKQDVIIIPYETEIVHLDNSKYNILQRVKHG